MPDPENESPFPISSRGEQTREQILNAAFQVFCEQGYHGASMRQIARNAGIALGGIYNHFASKEEIFLTVLYRHHPIFRMFPEIASAAGDDAAAFVRAAAERIVASFDGRSDFLKLVFIELVEFDGSHVPRLVEMVIPHIHELGQRFAAFEGQLRPIPCPIQVRAFISLFFAYLVLELLAGKEMAAEIQANALEHFIDIFLHGILAAPGDPNTAGALNTAAKTE